MLETGYFNGHASGGLTNTGLLMEGLTNTGLLMEVVYATIRTKGARDVSWCLRQSARLLNRIKYGRSRVGSRDAAKIVFQSS